MINKPHLKTQDGVCEVSLDLHDLVVKYLKERAIELPSDIDDVLYNDIWKYIDKLADYPDYGNYN